MQARFRMYRLRLQAIQAHTGIAGMHFALKPLTCPDDLLSALSPSNGPSHTPPFSEVECELDAAKALAEGASQYVHRLSRKEYMVLNGKRQIWELVEEVEAVNAISATHVAEARLWWKNKPGQQTNHHSNTQVATNIAKMMLRRLPEDDNFRAELQQASRMKLFYANGYWDFRRQLFEPHEGGHAMTAARISRPFPDWPGDEAIQEFNSRVLALIFPMDDERQAFLTFASRGLAGMVQVRIN
jgi:hypothetical protein